MHPSSSTHQRYRRTALLHNNSKRAKCPFYNQNSTNNRCNGNTLSLGSNGSNLTLNIEVNLRKRWWLNHRGALNKTLEQTKRIPHGAYQKKRILFTELGGKQSKWRRSISALFKSPSLLTDIELTLGRKFMLLADKGVCCKNSCDGLLYNCLKQSKRFIILTIKQKHLLLKITGLTTNKNKNF